MTICRREVSPARRPTPDRHARRTGACFVLQEVPLAGGPLLLGGKARQGDKRACHFVRVTSRLVI